MVPPTGQCACVDKAETDTTASIYGVDCISASCALKVLCQLCAKMFVPPHQISYGSDEPRISAFGQSSPVTAAAPQADHTYS